MVVTLCLGGAAPAAVALVVAGGHGALLAETAEGPPGGTALLVRGGVEGAGTRRIVEIPHPRNGAFSNGPRKVKAGPSRSRPGPRSVWLAAECKAGSASTR